MVTSKIIKRKNVSSRYFYKMIEIEIDGKGSVYSVHLYDNLRQERKTLALRVSREKAEEIWKNQIIEIVEI